MQPLFPLIQGGNAVTTLIANSPYVGLFVLLILGGFGIPIFPEDATFILCGFLINSQKVKTVPALFVVYAGVLIADCIIYALGKKYGRMVVRHRWFHGLISPDKLIDLEDSFKKKGVLIILLGRHFIGLRVQIFIVSGIMRMNPLKFLLADAVTVTFTIAVMVMIGYLGGHSLKDLGIDIIRTRYLAIFLFASFIIGYLIFKYIQKKKTADSLNYLSNIEYPSGLHSGKKEDLNDKDKNIEERKQKSLTQDFNNSGHSNRIAWIERLLPFLVFAGVALLLHQLGILQFFTSKERIFQFLDSMGIWDEVVFVMLEAVQVIIPSIPGMFLNMLGGYLYGTILGAIFSTIGTTIGGYIVFLISRRFGRQIINRYFPQKLMKRFGSIPHTKGRVTIFLLFLIPGFPKDYLCYTLGYLSTLEFFTITITGRLMGTVMETLGGDFIRHQQYQELYLLVGIAFTIIILVLIFRKRIERLLRKIQKEQS